MLSKNQVIIIFVSFLLLNENLPFEKNYSYKLQSQTKIGRSLHCIKSLIVSNDEYWLSDWRRLFTNLFILFSFI